MLPNLMGLGTCLEYDANSVCVKTDATTPESILSAIQGGPSGALTPAPATTGLEVIAEAIAAGKVGATVPLTRCPWYSTPTIGEKSLICQFPSPSVLILGGAAILGLAFFSMRA